MSTPSARRSRDRTTDTLSGKRVSAVVMAQAASGILGDPAAFAINPTQILQLASANTRLFVRRVHYLSSFGNFLRRAWLPLARESR
jgi:hypothetical protein